MHKSKGSPRKFSEKIALLNKKEAEGNAEFEKIIKEVEQTTRAPASWYPSRSSSSSSWIDSRTYDEYQQYQSLDYVPVHNGMQPLQVQQQHQQQVQLMDPTQQNHVNVNTPAGVPNIAIFPIEDDIYTQELTTTNNSTNLYRYDCSNAVSSARSLPDIANLKVEDPCIKNFNSFSQQRLAPTTNYTNDYNGYDANSNIVNDEAQGQIGFCSNLNEQVQAPVPHNLHQHQQNPFKNSWDATSNIDLQHNNSQSQTTNFNCYHRPQEPYQQHYSQGQMIRANSMNTVLSNWGNSDTLDAPKINSNLSKSSEVYYGYHRIN